jgi:hypothetical protein
MIESWPYGTKVLVLSFLDGLVYKYQSDNHDSIDEGQTRERGRCLIDQTLFSHHGDGSAEFFDVHSLSFAPGCLPLRAALAG